MKPIRITPHAEERIVARKIDIELINRTIRQSDQIVPDEDNIKRQIYQSVFSDENGKQKLLRVVIEETEDELVVITIYATSQVKKYWKINDEF